MQVLFIWLAVAFTIGITLAVVMGRRGTALSNGSSSD